MAIVYRNRDPFAKLVLIAETEDAGQYNECKWCGCKAPTQGRNKGKLRAYRKEMDNGYVFFFTGLYCSHACFKSYNES